MAEQAWRSGKRDQRRPVGGAARARAGALSDPGRLPIA